MSEVTCSFCGRNKKDVDLMISGIHAHICDKCVTQAGQILIDEKKSKTEINNGPNFKLIKPLEVKNSSMNMLSDKMKQKRFYL